MKSTTLLDASGQWRALHIGWCGGMVRIIAYQEDNGKALK